MKTRYGRFLFGFFCFALLGAGNAFGQTLTLTPTCGKPGDKVCVTGSGWAEPIPVCRYTFAFDGVIVAPAQPDGVFGPPSTKFTVPAVADGDHTAHVELRQNFPDVLLQQKDAPFKVLTNAAGSSVQTAGAGSNSLTATYKAPDPCETSCKRIVFIQTVRRFVVKTDGTEVITTANDWNIADAASKAMVETNPGRMRVDNDWGVSPPYYNVSDSGVVPPAGGNAGYGTIGSTTPTRIDGSMNDTPSINLANFNGGFPITETILRFMSAPFCIEGNDAGKYLGYVVTWEDHKTATSGPTVSAIAVTQGQPGSEFNQAVANWNGAHAFAFPQYTAPMCIYNP